MHKFFWVLILFFALAGCLRKIPIEQGNIFTSEMTSQLQIGMTETEVKNIMGTPILMNTFNTHRVDYVYTFKADRLPLTKKYITLIFQDGHLKHINGNLYSQYIK